MCDVKWGCSFQATCTVLPISTRNTALLRERQPQDDHSWSLVLKYASLKMEPVLNAPETLQHWHLCSAWFPPRRLQHSFSHGLRLLGWFLIEWAQTHAGDIESKAELQSPFLYGFCGARSNCCRSCASYIHQPAAICRTKVSQVH